jgi:hypothetical protein
MMMCAFSWTAVWSGTAVCTAVCTAVWSGTAVERSSLADLSRLADVSARLTASERTSSGASVIWLGASHSTRPATSMSKHTDRHPLGATACGGGGSTCSYCVVGSSA